MVCTYSTFLGALKCLGIKLALGLGIIGLVVGALFLVVYIEGKK